MLWRKKKYIYASVKCLACDGTGKNTPLTGWGLDTKNINVLKMMQGICLACNGMGVQNILKEVVV